jgi:hypothetical protein
MSALEDELSEFDQAAERVVELGNQIMTEFEDADSWDVASGLLAGAVQFWLYSRQPCGDPTCDSCADISTAAERLQKLIEETREYAEESDYYHSPRDTNVGTA